MEKSIVELGWPHMTIWRMRIACWIPKATHTHTHTHNMELGAFALQQWLHEGASVLRNSAPSVLSAFAPAEKKKKSHCVNYDCT